MKRFLALLCAVGMLLVVVVPAAAESYSASVNGTSAYTRLTDGSYGAATVSGSNSPQSGKMRYYGYSTNNGYTDTGTAWAGENFSRYYQGSGQWRAHAERNANYPVYGIVTITA
ncbi:Uncharacterised protein [Anaerotruncus sp. 2789STDY5834896]|uniref:Lactococcin 972 family bacteriocin n=1 Tax=uncultured Anaerotruncus sp. TaxID=905011 RepID=A0A1C6JVV2_9FIRM|nr:Uncharacterised protein [uncultured Anaerotruncus sp.]